MKYVFGPVPSRRLGRSLGIDPVPAKTCNWNCIYCQLGRTVPVSRERREYYPREEIIAEVATALQKYEPGEIDWITFAGSGEPTLHAGLGWMIRRVKKTTGIPVAVLTNGSLLYLQEVRREISAADAVLPSLDAGRAELFKKINRPHPESSFERLVLGLKEFRKIFRGKLWIEVMLIRGLNDTEEALTAISRILEGIKPDAVHINLPTRVPAESDVEPADEEGLLRAAAILGNVTEIVRPTEITPDLAAEPDPVATLIGIISRHPVSEEDLHRWIRGQSHDLAEKILARLEASGRVKLAEGDGPRFWTPSYGRYRRQGRKKEN